MKAAAITVALTLAVSTLNAFAQNAGAPPRGFHLLPPHAQDQLNLSTDQQKQVADLEAEVKSKLEKILTPQQMDQLKQMRPPQRSGGAGGGTGGGAGGAPGGGPSGASGQPKRQRPPSE